MPDGKKINQLTPASSIADTDVLALENSTGTGTKKATAAQIANYAKSKGANVDATLTRAGVPADAKAAGDAVTDLKSALNYSKTATPGYILRATDEGTGQEWAQVGTPTDAQTSEAVSNWLDAHPEATTTVQDDAITFAKMNRTAYAGVGIMDNEFLKMGGVFGTTESDQRTLNAQILSELFTKYNGLRFISANNTIEVQDFSAELKNDSIINGLRLTCYGSKNSVFYASAIVNRININNVIIGNEGQYKYAIRLGGVDGSIGAPYSTFEHVTVSHFAYPFVLHGWNCAIGRMQFYNCTFGAILTGTSIDAQALYANSCLHGHCLGAFPDEEYTAQGTYTNVYLLYSNFGILSTDSSNDCECAVAVGDVRYISIEALSYENASKLKYVINNYSTTYFPVITIQNLYGAGTPSGGFVINKTNNAKKPYIIISQDFGEYLATAYNNIDNCDISFIRGSTYTGASRNKNDALFMKYSDTVSKESQLKYSGVGLVNGGGSTAVIPQYNTYGVFIGNVTKDQSIKINLEHGSRSLASSGAVPQRQHVLLAKLWIGNADQYNSTKIFGETLIGFALDVYTQGGDYSSKLQISNPITNLDITVDSTKTYPTIVITPSATGSSRNYIFKLELLAGAASSVVVNS